MVLLLRLGAALFCLSSFLFSLPWVEADITNRTIDDTSGDSVTGQKVVYTPAMDGTWKDAGCNDCNIMPDISKTFNKTYTAATYRPPTDMSITMQFNGIAIYVFVLANDMGNTTVTTTVANITLNGGVPQLYTHRPDPKADPIEYNQLVWSQTNLEPIQHTLVISTSGGDTQSYVNFDYAIYTHDDGSSSTSSSASQTNSAISNPTSSKLLSKNKKGSSTGAVVGGFLGGLAILASVSALCLYLVRRRRHRRKDLRSEANGYSPPLITEFNAPKESQTSLLPGLIDPFVDSYHSRHNGGSKARPVRGNAMELIQISTFSNDQIQLRSVTSGDHLSTSNTNLSATPMATRNNIEATRQARQKELEQCLRTVQEEMAALASDLSSGREVRRRSIGKGAVIMTPPRTQQEETVTGQSEERDTNIEEMKEQLRVLRDRIDYLTAQQQSLWAQGLSDEPPPGYTTASRFT